MLPISVPHPAGPYILRVRDRLGVELKPGIYCPASSTTTAMVLASPPNLIEIEFSACRVIV
jgi:hypothetical protein